MEDDAACPSFALSTFVTHSVPELRPNDVFVLACTVPGKKPHNFKKSLKYHLAEFGAFKFLIERIADKTEPQFLTSVEPINFPYLNYGDKNVLPGWMPYGERKYQYFDYKSTIVPKVGEEHLCLGEIWQALGTKIQAAADQILEGGDPSIRLVVIICGPTDLQQNLLLNLEMPIPTSKDFVPEFVLTDDLRESVGQGVHSVLITPNMLGAGWVVNPTFTAANGWPGSAVPLTDAALRRASCNVAPLVSKDVRTTHFKDELMCLWADYRGPFPELTEFRKAFQRASLGFFFERYPATGLNFDEERDNWNYFSEQCRQSPLGPLKLLWDSLPPAIYLQTDQSRVNHSPSLVQTTGVAGWLDRTLLPNHCKVLALVQRNEWMFETCEEKKKRLLDINAQQHLPRGEAPGAGDKLKFTSSYRLACHNLADLIVEGNPSIPAWPHPAWMRSSRFMNRFPSRYGPVGVRYSQPHSLEDRMDWITAIIYDSTHSEFLDDPLGINDMIENPPANFIRSDERSSRIVRYLAELLQFWPTDQSACRFDVRPSFRRWCEEAAIRDPGIQKAIQDLKEALNRRRLRSESVS